MTGIQQMQQFLLLIICLSLSGCAIPTGGWTKPTSQWAGIDEVTMLKSVYDETGRLSTLSKKSRVSEYRNLQQKTKASADLRDHLLLAALLGGLEPSLTDYAKAGQELDKARRQAASTPLILSYIRSQSGMIAQLDKAQASRQNTRVKRPRRTRKAVPKEKAEPEEIVTQATSSNEQALVSRLSNLEVQLKDRNSKINELEAKIQALSAIERSLNQRTQ